MLKYWSNCVPSRSKSRSKSTTQTQATQWRHEPDLKFDASADVTPIVEFLDSFRQMVDPRAQHPSKLISIKVPEPLLAAFRFKSKQEGTPYQTKIKELMLEWLKA